MRGLEVGSNTARMQTAIPIRIVRNRLTGILAATLSLASVAGGVAWAADTPSQLTTALTAGKPYAALRYRFERVDEEPLAEEAHASTLRLRFGYETAVWHGLNALIEVDQLAAVGTEAFDSTRNGRTNRPIVADPPATDLNQATLRWRHGSDEWLVGRQRLALDNYRFVGNVGWRQNEQTFDALTWRSKRVPRTALTLGYIDNVNRVFGPDAGAPPADLRARGVIAHAAIDAKALGVATPFVHLFDFRNAPALSHRNVGIHWFGQRKWNQWSANWSASFVLQSDYADNPTSYDANYWQLEAGLGRGPLTIKVGQETLEGDATRSERRFQTPLATLHAFQGWADKFLTTPPQGIEDRYAMLALKWRGAEAQLVWHDFGAEAVSRNYGSEWDASLGRRFGVRTDVLLKAARYEAGGFARDTTKVWLQVAAEFK
jgi:hypothetical protein